MKDFRLMINVSNNEIPQGFKIIDFSSRSTWIVIIINESTFCSGKNSNFISTYITNEKINCFPLPISCTMGSDIFEVMTPALFQHGTFQLQNKLLKTPETRNVQRQNMCKMSVQRKNLGLEQSSWKADRITKKIYIYIMS